MTPRELTEIIMKIMSDSIFTVLPMSQAEMIEAGIKQAKSEWCRQQRVICADNLITTYQDGSEDRNAILNSKEPE